MQQWRKALQLTEEDVDPKRCRISYLAVSRMVLKSVVIDYSTVRLR